MNFDKNGLLRGVGRDFSSEPGARIVKHTSGPARVVCVHRASRPFQESRSRLSSNDNNRKTTYFKKLSKKEFYDRLDVCEDAKRSIFRTQNVSN